jgi:hypothetical protein
MDKLRELLGKGSINVSNVDRKLFDLVRFGDGCS